MEEQHIYHHSDSDGPRVNVKVVQNTKGFNYEASVQGCKTVEEAMSILMEVQKKLDAEFGNSAA